jgi:hypothetical protein
MKRYIKINDKKEIVDIFHEHVTASFDGTEILLDDVQKQDVHLMGKCITDQWGFPYFKYENKKVVETTAYDAQRLLKAEETEKAKKVQQLAATDSNMQRITEDIIDLLIAKNIIKKTDMPAEVQAKLDERKALREEIG